MESTAIENIQQENGKPQTEKREKEYYRRGSDNWFFQISDVEWKDKETGVFSKPKRSITIAGRKSYKSGKRMYLIVSPTRAALEEFKEHMLPRWEKAVVDEEERGPLEKDNMEDL